MLLGHHNGYIAIEKRTLAKRDQKTTLRVNFKNVSNKYCQLLRNLLIV